MLPSGAVWQNGSIIWITMLAEAQHNAQQCSGPEPEIVKLNYSGQHFSFPLPGPHQAINLAELTFQFSGRCT